MTRKTFGSPLPTQPFQIPLANVFPPSFSLCGLPASQCRCMSWRIFVTVFFWLYAAKRHSKNDMSPLGQLQERAFNIRCRNFALGIICFWNFSRCRANWRSFWCSLWCGLWCGFLRRRRILWRIFTIMRLCVLPGRLAKACMMYNTFFPHPTAQRKWQHDNKTIQKYTKETASEKWHQNNGYRNHAMQVAEKWLQRKGYRKNNGYRKTAKIWLQKMGSIAEEKIGKHMAAQKRLQQDTGKI